MEVTTVITLEQHDREQIIARATYITNGFRMRRAQDPQMSSWTSTRLFLSQAASTNTIDTI